jgi:hypothetical protein
MDPPPSPTPNELPQLQRPQQLQQQWRSGAASSSSSATATTASHAPCGGWQCDRMQHEQQIIIVINISKLIATQLWIWCFKGTKNNNNNNNNNTSRPSTSTAPIVIQQEQTIIQTQQQQYSRNAAKIIKGEIHNVLTESWEQILDIIIPIPEAIAVLVVVGSRFEYEERQQQQFHRSGRWGSGISTSSGRFWHVEWFENA